MMYILLILLSYILPVIFLILGVAFSKHPPKDINSFSGYRTTRSMKNIDTWKEANIYSAKLLFKFSLFLLVFATFGVISAGNSYELAIVVILSSIILSIISLVLTIIKTENHLKNYEKTGVNHER